MARTTIQNQVVVALEDQHNYYDRSILAGSREDSYFSKLGLLEIQARSLISLDTPSEDYFVNEDF